MIKELMYKWFGLEPFPCNVCEVLRSQLDKVESERRELLQKLLAQSEPPPSSQEREKELRPILPQHVPWRVRQQMLEAEYRAQARLMKEKQKEISELEKELGVGE